MLGVLEVSSIITILKDIYDSFGLFLLVALIPLAEIILLLMHVLCWNRIVVFTLQITTLNCKWIIIIVVIIVIN